MWNTFNTEGPLGITAEIITFPGGDGADIHAYFARSLSAEKRPGIVVIHHQPGWDEFYLEFCERLARHGFDVLAPDLYCRFGHGTPDDVAAIARKDGFVSDEDVVADCKAAAQWLKALPTSNGKVGVTGSCSGGRHAMLAASLTDEFAAVVDLWGGSVVMAPEQLSPQKPVAPIDYTERLSAPVLGLFGNDDQSPSAEQVDIHEAELKRLNKTYEFHRYDGASHGFMYFHTHAYRQEAAMDAWEHMLKFFADNLSA